MAQMFVTSSWLIAFVGMALLMGSLLSHAVKWIFRISDDDLSSEWWRRHDTAGIAWGVKWTKPGLILFALGSVIALILETAFM